MLTIVSIDLMVDAGESHRDADLGGDSYWPRSLQEAGLENRGSSSLSSDRSQTAETDLEHLKPLIPKPRNRRNPCLLHELNLENFTNPSS